MAHDHYPLTASEMAQVSDGLMRLRQTLDGLDPEVKIAILIGYLVGAAQAMDIDVEGLVERVRLRYPQ